MRIMRFFAPTVAFAILVMFFMAYSNNTGSNGEFDAGTYWDSFVATFGGLGSFLALLGILVLMAVIFFVLRVIGNFNRDLSYGIATLLIIIATAIGGAFVRIDLGFFGGFWPFIGFLLACAISTAIILSVGGYMPIPRRRTTTTTTV